VAAQNLRLPPVCRIMTTTIAYQDSANRIVMIAVRMRMLGSPELRPFQLAGSLANSRRKRAMSVSARTRFYSKLREQSFIVERRPKRQLVFG